jgi:glycosyltransferase involved in cell wall biosynthesis
LKFNKDKKLKILLIGPLPPPIGGTAISFMHLVKYIKNNKEVVLHIVDTTGVRYNDLFQAINNSINILRNILYKIRRVDIVGLNIGTDSISTFGLVVFIVAKIFRKGIIIRKFNGNDVIELNFIKRAISIYIIRKCELYLVQTKILLESANDQGINHTRWFPTNRPMPQLMNGKKRKCRRFIFLGWVNSSKGVIELINAGERLTEDVIIDVYGPMIFDIDYSVFNGLKRVRYKGIINPEMVISKLIEYDALVLPTYHKNEGYPGVILEAYSAGIPVITTKWKAIPEIVNETTGLLIEPRNSDDLFRAMEKLYKDDDYYISLVHGVTKRRDEFSSDYWGECFMSYCKDLFQTKSYFKL